MPSRRAVLAGLGSGVGMAVAPVAGQSTAVPAPTWTRRYAPGNPETALVRDVVPVDDGAVVVGLAGDLDRYRGWVARVDAGGRLQWHHRVGTVSTALLAAAPAVRDDETAAAAGATNVGDSPIDPSVPDPYLLRTDGDGSDTGATYQPAATSGRAAALTRLADGYLLAGSVNRPADPGRRSWATHTDASGTRQWAWHGTQPGTVYAATTTAEGVVLGGAGSAAGSGAERANGRSEDALVVALTPAGDRAWQWRTDRAGGDRIEALAPAPDGGVLAVGRRGFSADDRGVGWTVRLDATGEQQWTRTYPQSAWNWHHDVCAREAGYVLVGTRQAGTAVADRGAWVQWLDATGQVTREYQGPAGTRGFAGAPLEDGGLLVGGGSEADADGVDQRAWLAKLGGDAAPAAGGGPGELPSVPGWVAPVLAGGALGVAGTKLAAQRRG